MTNNKDVWGKSVVELMEEASHALDIILTEETKRVLGRTKMLFSSSLYISNKIKDNTKDKS